MGLTPGWVFGYVPTPQQWSDAISSKIDDLSVVFATPGTGATLESGILQGGWILDPPGEIATLAIVAPPGSANQQRFTISTTQAIDALTITPVLGQSLNGGGPYVLSGDGVVSFIFRLANLTWYRWSGS